MNITFAKAKLNHIVKEGVTNMPKIEGTKGICRLCFEPVWVDQDFIISKSKLYYHGSCTKRVPDLNEWEDKHIIPRRDLDDTKAN